MPNFWADGPAAYRDVLNEEMKTQIAELNSRLSLAITETERKTIREQIKSIEKQAETKLQGLSGSLF